MRRFYIKIIAQHKGEINKGGNSIYNKYAPFRSNPMPTGPRAGRGKQVVLPGYPPLQGQRFASADRGKVVTPTKRVVPRV